MVHFTAPETAADILSTPDTQSIRLDERAEVYAPAAVFTWHGLVYRPPATPMTKHRGGTSSKT